MCRFSVRLGIALSLSVSAAAGALAQSPEWKNTAEVYFMGGAISGTTAVGPVEAQVDLSASQLLNNLQFGAMLNYRGETETYAVNADVVFMGLGATRDSANGLLTTKVDADQWIIQAHGSWRVTPVLEVLGGLRFTSIADTVGKGWSVEGYGDIGGFGVGCDLTWMLQGRVNWQISPLVGVGLGYRALYQNYSSGSGSDYYKWKITMQGPLAAVNVSF